MVGHILKRISTNCKGGSPGLVVMGGDSRSEGCGFESQRCTYTECFYNSRTDYYLHGPIDQSFCWWTLQLLVLLLFVI